VVLLCRAQPCVSSILLTPGRYPLCAAADVCIFCLSTPKTPTAPTNITLKLASLSLNLTGPIQIRDIWAKQFLPGTVASGSSFTAVVPHHGSQFYVMMAAGAVWPKPFKLAPWMEAPVQ
jgi:hypothetical protein